MLLENMMDFLTISPSGSSALIHEILTSSGAIITFGVASIPIEGGSL